MINSIPPLFDSGDYRKSSFSTGDDPACVEVARRGGALVSLRDSKVPSEGHIAVPAARLDTLIAGIRAGAIQ